jgi:5-hydroxyisourate hydrolase-like protein (transthyretin family)
MTNLQENHLNMQRTVVTYCGDGTIGGITIPYYGENLEILAITNDRIEQTGEEQETGTTGIAANKKQLRTVLNTAASDTARKLTSFAKLTNNLVLLGEVDYSETDFRHFTDNLVREKAQVICNKANDYLSELAPYGITEETQLVLQTAINNFSEVMVAPRLGATTRKQATKQLKVLFKQAADALEKIDSAVELVKLTDPVFYEGYKTARKIVNQGSGKLAVKGFVTDAQSGEPVKGVTITFMNDGETTPAALAASAEPIIIKTTAAKGGFNIKSLPAGIYRVSFKKMGYTEQFATVNVNDGELSTVDVAIHKNQAEG